MRLSARLIILITCLYTLAMPGVYAQQTADERTYSEWMSYYYMDKDNDGVVPFLKWLNGSRMLEKNPGAIHPISAFLSILFTQHPAEVDVWIKSASFSGNAKVMLQKALWLSRNRPKLAKFGAAPVYVREEPPSLTEFAIVTPADLDMMWGAFFASGDTIYVKKVTALFDESVTPNADAITRAAAEWSLGSNMIQHETINRFIRAELATASGTRKRKLQEQAARYDKAMKRFSSTDGEFSARLILIDYARLQDYLATPPEKLDTLKVAQAIRGQSVVPKLLFSGMQLAENLQADVTYDLKILRPDGTVYGFSESKNREGIKKRIPSRATIFDNALVEGVKFEPADAPGTYTFTAEIRDNIGKKKIRLSESVQLVE